MDKPDKQLTFIKALNISIEFGFIIVLPLVAFAYLGKYLDHRYHTGNQLFLLLGIVLALLSSSLWFYRRIQSIMKDLTK